MSNIYQHWETEDAMDQFGEPRDLFASEVYFLDKIMQPNISMLDVGCGTGAVYHALKNKYAGLDYTGIDISANMLKRAQELAPDQKWIKGNFIDDNILDTEQQFDLTFATGVFQHEPRTEELLQKMLHHTKYGGYVLFDVKLLNKHQTLRDINISYCDLEHRLHYIALNWADFFEIIFNHDNKIQEMQVYGYYAGMNKSVRIPKTVEEKVCSANILLKRGEHDNDKPFPMLIKLPINFLNRGL